MPTAALVTRKHVSWHTWLDLAVGLTFPTADTPGLIHLAGPGLADDGSCALGAVPGCLVVVGIANPGWTTVHGTDFTVPLAFSFPGRQVTAAWVSPRFAARTGHLPTIRLRPVANSGDTGGVQLAGDFVLRPGDGYTITFVLTGTPTADSPPVRHDGALIAGKITREPDPG